MLFFGRKKRLIDYASCAGWAGKLPAMGIAQVLRSIPKVEDPNLLVGTETHDDAGVYKLTEDLALVQTIDFFPPVVNDPFVYGQIAAANALSDIYAMGGTPKTALNLVGYPDDKDPGLGWLGKILEGGAERCRAAGAVVVGGHTVRDAEIKFGMAVTGIIHPQRIFTNAAARPGDKLVLTKALGTGFVTTAHKAGDCPEDLFEAACASMVQLNDIGRDAMLAVGAHAATDITGFGLAGHAFEMAEGSRATLVLELSRLPLLPGAEGLAHKPYLTRASATNAAYVQPGLRVEGRPDPVRLEFFYDAQTSGGLLISVPADRAEALVESARKRGAASACVVGEVVERTDVALIVRPWTGVRKGGSRSAGVPMNGTAPTRFAAWMAAHEHRDAKLGFVYRYHPRSDAHSKELCRLTLEDLVASCPSLRAHAEADKVVYGINCLYTFPVSRKTKTLDLVIAKGEPEEGAERVGGVIAPAAVLGTVKVGNRKVKQLAIDRVLLSCESKAAMTEHVKSKPRLFDELSSSHEIVHQGDPKAIAAGITVVNIAKTFVSPTRQKGGSLIVTQHRQPEVTRQMVEHLRGLPIRTGPSSAGFDAYATVVIDCDNQKVASLWTAPPAPQPGDRDHYDTFLATLSRAYEQRFGKKGV